MAARHKAAQQRLEAESLPEDARCTRVEARQVKESLVQAHLQGRGVFRGCGLACEFKRKMVAYVSQQIEADRVGEPVKILAALHKQLQWYWSDSDSDPMTDDIVVKERQRAARPQLDCAVP